MELFLKAVLIIFLIVFLGLFLFSIILIAVHRKTGGALFVPTPQVVLDTIMEHVDFSQYRDIRELGAGDGRFMAAVEKTHGLPVIGYEVNPLAYLLCRLRLGVSGLSSRVEYESFWEADLGGAQAVFCYLFPDIMPRLGEKLAHELDDGALVISANFPLPGWTPEGIIHSDHPVFNDPVFLYRKGAHLKRTGRR
ncbi:MAG: hypothetical protein M0R18_02715 [Deltaproteobacteria bacterium]|jgi:hypothetical protein|nr:hypothetical protein [Deltaproteobacteria bacterium]MDX9760496.1 hypothetical protein [Desulfomonilia bacterium]HPW68874.1 hypothetical protein [Deltaproteobacteria bacterium]